MSDFKTFSEHPIMKRTMDRMMALMDERYGPRGAPETLEEFDQLAAEAFAAEPGGLAFLEEFNPVEFFTPEL